MKIQLTDQEINLKKDSTGFYYYKLNGILVEGFKTSTEALQHAQRSFTDFIKNKYLSNQNIRIKKNQ